MLNVFCRMGTELAVMLEMVSVTLQGSMFTTVHIRDGPWVGPNTHEVRCGQV